MGKSYRFIISCALVAGFALAAMPVYAGSQDARQKRLESLKTRANDLARVNQGRTIRPPHKANGKVSR